MFLNPIKEVQQMTKTKRELEEKIVELQKTLMDNGIEEKKDNLLTKMEELELNTVYKIQAKIQVLEKAVKVLKEACERETGRQLKISNRESPISHDYSSWNYTNSYTPAETGNEVKVNIDFNANTPLREVAHKLVRFLKDNNRTSFRSNLDFTFWFKQQLGTEFNKQGVSLRKGK